MNYSRGYLRAYSVVLCSEMLFNLEKYNLVEAAQNDSEQSKSITSVDIKLVVEAEQLIDELHDKVLTFFTEHPLDKKDQKFVDAQVAKMIDKFLYKTEILKKGVITHLLFMLTLYIYFIESQWVSEKNINSDFDFIRDESVYQEIMDITDSFEEFTYLDHCEAVHQTLSTILG
jgi:hypothetical protein